VIFAPDENIREDQRAEPERALHQCTQGSVCAASAAANPAPVARTMAPLYPNGGPREGAARIARLLSHRLECCSELAPPPLVTSVATIKKRKNGRQQTWHV
jgi:hypothetical protein